MRRGVEGAGERYAQVCVAGAAEVLDGGEGTGPHHEAGVIGHRTVSVSRALSRGTKCTRVPGVSRAAFSRRGSHSTASVRPISCQPPGEERG